MTRARVAILILLAGFLLHRDSSLPPVLPVVRTAPQSGVNAADVAHILKGANPQLSPREVERISSAVMRCEERYDLAPELVAAVLLVESAARPWARSPKGAMGLMQVMPAMMSPIGMVGNFTTIESNVEAGCWILASNIRRLGEEAGISTYFWGNEIRGIAYLERVKAARNEVRRRLSS